MKKIIIDGNKFKTIEGAADYISENVDESRYDDDLDSCYGEIKIGCCTFYPSQILKECDPIAYRCGFSDFQNFVYEDAMDWLKDKETTIYGFDIEYIEESEEE